MKKPSLLQTYKQMRSAWTANLDAGGKFQIAAVGRTVFMFIDSPDLPILARMRTQRLAAQCGREIDRAVREAIEAVLARYPEVTR